MTEHRRIYSRTLCHSSCKEFCKYIGLIPRRSVCPLGGPIHSEQSWMVAQLSQHHMGQGAAVTRWVPGREIWNPYKFLEARRSAWWSHIGCEFLVICSIHRGFQWVVWGLYIYSHYAMFIWSANCFSCSTQHVQMASFELRCMVTVSIVVPYRAVRVVEKFFDHVADAFWNSLNGRIAELLSSGSPCEERAVPISGDAKNTFVPQIPF